jgi:hypothetical protein
MAAKTKRRSIGELVDELGDVRLELDTLKKKETAIREEILGHRVGEGEGLRWRFSVSSSARWSIDVGRLRQDLGDDRIAPYNRLSTVTTIRVTPRPIPAGAALVKAAA